MNKILNQTDVNVISIKKITNQSLVGIRIRENKYIIVSKKHFGELLYTRMNDRFDVLEDNKQSKRFLLEKMAYSEAFEFATKKEMLDWLFKPVQ